MALIVAAVAAMCWFAKLPPRTADLHVLNRFAAPSMMQLDAGVLVCWYDTEGHRGRSVKGDLCRLIVVYNADHYRWPAAEKETRTDQIMRETPEEKRQGNTRRCFDALLSTHSRKR